MKFTITKTGIKVVPVSRANTRRKSAPEIEMCLELMPEESKSKIFIHHLEKC